MADKMNKGVTIGTFDGVHRGHRLVLDTLKEESAKRGLSPVAITFDRHPLAVIAPQRAPGDLTTPQRKAELIRREGVEPLVLPFTEQLRKMTAYEWLNHIYRKYGVRLLVVGYDNTFGSDGIDLTLADYQAMGEEIGIEVVKAKEEKGVSSSAVRKAIKAGDIAKANSLLGHEAEVEGKVTHGFHVGAEIGFPTANIQPASGTLVPAGGVYAASAEVLGEDGAVFPAMVNIGSRPTFAGSPLGSDHLTVEAHLIGADEDLYGKTIRLSFLSRLRDERKFTSVSHLQHQLSLDKAETLRLASGSEETVS